MKPGARLVYDNRSCMRDCVLSGLEFFALRRRVALGQK